MPIKIEKERGPGLDLGGQELACKTFYHFISIMYLHRIKIIKAPFIVLYKFNSSCAQLQMNAKVMSLIECLSHLNYLNQIKFIYYAK